MVAQIKSDLVTHWVPPLQHMAHLPMIPSCNVAMMQRCWSRVALAQTATKKSHTLPMAGHAMPGPSIPHGAQYEPPR